MEGKGKVKHNYYLKVISIKCKIKCFTENAIVKNLVSNKHSLKTT